MVKTTFIFSLVAIVAVSANAQMATNVPTSASSITGAWTDPALNHNKLLIQKTGEGNYKIIGTFKVMGTSYLYGENHKGDMFATEAKAFNIYLSYNTYNQEVEFTSTSNPEKPLIKEPGTVDSFMIHPNIQSGITEKLKFFYGPLIGSKEKAYFLLLHGGTRFSIYKRYKSELGYVSSNYIQSELREFDLQVEYFYTDTQGKGVKKLKPNAFTVTKEFKDIKDLSAVVTADDFSVNPDAAFKKAFETLNN